MTFSYYKLGTRFCARKGDKTYIISLDDITTHRREIEGPALIYVNPPFRRGSLVEFQRQAAKTTHGIRFVQIEDIYQAIAGMIRPGDEIVWMIPPTGEFEEILAKNLSENNLGQNFKIERGVGKDKTVTLAYSSGLIGSIAINPVTLGRIDSNDSAATFTNLFPTGLQGVKTIFDPCAGANPLLPHAIRLGVNYFGVETNSFKAMNIDLLKRMMRRNGADITGIPDSVDEAPDGIVIGAPPTMYKPESEQRVHGSGLVTGTGKRAPAGNMYGKSKTNPAEKIVGKTGDPLKAKMAMIKARNAQRKIR